ncbi:MAG: hypothetical protein PHS14_17975 [Elusimicrobia bacterium]|nr:hypothetical protein [Elusimicrobiota bacterium]
MLTHTRVLKYKTAEGVLADTSDSVSGQGGFAFDDTVVHNATPANSEIEIAFAFTRANMKSLLISAGAAGIVVRSNEDHTGAPGDTVTVPAGGAVVWNTNDPAGSNPFKTADVTTLFVTNASATLDTNVKIRVLLDVTP